MHYRKPLKYKILEYFQIENHLIINLIKISKILQLNPYLNPQTNNIYLQRLLFELVNREMIVNTVLINMLFYYIS